MDDYNPPSVKRRRSNDWPLPVEGSFGGSGIGRRGSPRASLAPHRARQTASSSPRHHRSGRRSRFIEASMGDSVSEKPPSIFTRETKPSANAQRQSGIFRFGKAIASAFNPFGSGWGKSPSPEGLNKSQQQPQTDALSQAEHAYAELKKAGYQGTNKGVYSSAQHVDSVAADHTWQSIQETMENGTAMGEGRVSVEQGTRTTPSRSDSRTSKRSSFQDLRRNIPFIKHEAPPTTSLDGTSEDSERGGGPRQKSRKERTRQAKLLKKVSDLEDKLERARRELRELTGNEQRMMPASTPQSSTLCMETDPGGYCPGKFVPGALPTLPSERLLDQQATPAKSQHQAAGLTALPAMEGRGSVSLEDSRPAQDIAAPVNSPKRRSKGNRPLSMGKDRSSSRKRKSPVPESLTSRKSPQPGPTHGIDDTTEREQLADFPLGPPRKAKWQKFEAGDSPGSVERKQVLSEGSQSTEEENERGFMMRNRSPIVQTRRFTPHNSTRCSPNSKPARNCPPPSRMRQDRPTLRSVPPSDDDAAAEENWLSPSPPAKESHRAFYLQPHHQLDPERSSRLSPALTRTRARKYLRVDDDIPPVPPLPKELLKNAAQVTKSPKKGSAETRDSVGYTLSPQTSSMLNTRPHQTSTEYQWPDDVF